MTSSDGDTEIVEYSLTHELQDGDCLLTRISSISENEELNPLQFVYGDPGTPSSGTFSPVDTIALPQLFEIGKENFIFRSGKLVPGNYGDAMVALPNYSTYAKVAEQWNSTHTERYYKYGSTYDANQIILVYPTLNGKSSLQTITADVEFQGIEVMDIDADGTDEIIKLNFAGCENNQTKLKITIYEYSGTSLRVRNTFTVSVTGVIPDGFYTNPIERFFWYGNFKGDGTVQLVSMNASRTYRGNYTPSKAAVIDLNTGQRLSENNLFDINTRSNTNSVFSYDIDGDGMTELCHANYTGMDVYKLSGNTFIKDRTIPGFDVYDLPGYSDTLSQIHLTDLNGDGSSANVVSRSVARDESHQLFVSKIHGNSRCSGHSECDSIIMDDAKIGAVPEITANHPDAALIHEAAIGKIAGDQITKLMTLGLTEAEAEEQIVNGFLK